MSDSNDELLESQSTFVLDTSSESNGTIQPSGPLAVIIYGSAMAITLLLMGVYLIFKHVLYRGNDKTGGKSLNSKTEGSKSNKSKSIKGKNMKGKSIKSGGNSKSNKFKSKGPGLNLKSKELNLKSNKGKIAKSLTKKT